jgi:DnaJ-class molecular chaperone
MRQCGRCGGRGRTFLGTCAGCGGTGNVEGEASKASPTGTGGLAQAQRDSDATSSVAGWHGHDDVGGMDRT